MTDYECGERYFLHAYGRLKPVMDHGEGCYLYDTEGHKYLDFYSGIGVNSFGYGYPKYTEALKKQLDRVTHVSNYFYTPESVKAAKRVCEATGLHQLFFCNSGAEATEGALKLARKYYYMEKGKADSEVISFNHSFHGRTTGAVRLTGNENYQKAFGPLINQVKYADLNDLDSVKALVTDKTAAIIVEPLQGEGGVNPCTKPFLQGLRKLCDDKGICLILDEVQCGMGRTGTLMTYMQYDIMPDILCLAKGIGAGVPIGAFVANEKYAKVLLLPCMPFGQRLRHSPSPLMPRYMERRMSILLGWLLKEKRFLVLIRSLRMMDTKLSDGVKLKIAQRKTNTPLLTR